MKMKSVYAGSVLRRQALLRCLYGRRRCYQEYASRLSPAPRAVMASRRPPLPSRLILHATAPPRRDCAFFFIACRHAAV